MAIDKVAYSVEQLKTIILAQKIATRSSCCKYYHFVVTSCSLDSIWTFDYTEVQ